MIRVNGADGAHARLAWYTIEQGGQYAGDILAAFELFLVRYEWCSELRFSTCIYYMYTFWCSPSHWSFLMLLFLGRGCWVAVCPSNEKWSFPGAKRSATSVTEDWAWGTYVIVVRSNFVSRPLDHFRLRPAKQDCGVTCGQNPSVLFTSHYLAHVMSIFSQVMCWGLRNMKKYQLTSVNSPSIDFEIGDNKITSTVIKSLKRNPNFDEPLFFFDVVSCWKNHDK